MQLSNVAAGPTRPGNEQSFLLATPTKQNNSLSSRTEVLEDFPYATSAASTDRLFSVKNGHVSLSRLTSN